MATTKTLDDQLGDGAATAATAAPDGLLVKVGRIIIIVSCIVLTTIALVSVATVGQIGGSQQAQLCAYLECIYILLQIVIGFYASLYRSKEAMFAFSVTCAINTIVLLVYLLIRPDESAADPSPYLQSWSALTSLGGQVPSADYYCSHHCDRCSGNKTCCQSHCGGGGDGLRHLPLASSNLTGKERFVRTVLWLLAAFNLTLTILSALIAINISPPLPVLAAAAAPRAHQENTKSRTPTRPSRSPPTLRPETSRMGEGAAAPVQSQSQSPSSTRRGRPASFRPQPVHLISQISRQHHYQQPSQAKSPAAGAKTSSPTGGSGSGGGGAAGAAWRQRAPATDGSNAENTVDSLRPAATRVEQ